MAETADAVVIGGGISGVNIAFHLARRGLKKVVLLEKTAIAAGASGKTGGLVGSHFGTEIKVRLAIKAMTSWLNFGEVYGVRGQYYAADWSVIQSHRDHLWHRFPVAARPWMSRCSAWIGLERGT